MAAIPGTYAERITYDTSLLPVPQWWVQTDDVAGFPAGPYLWYDDVWGYFGNAGIDQFKQVLIQAAEYPPLRIVRLRNAVTGGLTVAQFVARTSGVIEEGFEVGFRWAIQGAGYDLPIDIGSMFFQRFGGDKLGRWSLGIKGPGTALTTEIEGIASIDYRGVMRLGCWSSGQSILVPRVLYTQTAWTAGAGIVANTTSKTSLLGTGIGLPSLPADILESGRKVRVRASGFKGTTATPTLNIGLDVDGATLISTGAVATVGTINNHHWNVDAEFTFNGASIIGNGRYEYDNAAHNSPPRLGMPGLAGVALDPALVHPIDLWAQWGAASVSNTITCTQCDIEILN